MTSQPGFTARVLASKAAQPEPAHLTVWVRLDLGGGLEWVAVARIRGDKR